MSELSSMLVGALLKSNVLRITVVSGIVTLLALRVVLAVKGKSGDARKTRSGHRGLSASRRIPA
jgi:hypothetical protein